MKEQDFPNWKDNKYWSKYPPELAKRPEFNFGDYIQEIEEWHDDLVAELKKKAKWRVEKFISTETEDGAEVSRFRPRQYVRLDEVLVLLGAEQK